MVSLPSLATSAGTSAASEAFLPGPLAAVDDVPPALPVSPLPLPVAPQPAASNRTMGRASMALTPNLDTALPPLTVGFAASCHSIV